MNKALYKQGENWQRLRKKFLTWLVIIKMGEQVLTINNQLIPSWIFLKKALEEYGIIVSQILNK
jgi:hypothetical protein